MQHSNTLVRSLAGAVFGLLALLLPFARAGLAGGVTSVAQLVAAGDTLLGATVDLKAYVLDRDMLMAISAPESACGNHLVLVDHDPAFEARYRAADHENKWALRKTVPVVSTTEVTPGGTRGDLLPTQYAVYRGRLVRACGELRFDIERKVEEIDLGLAWPDRTETIAGGMVIAHGKPLLAPITVRSHDGTITINGEDYCARLQDLVTPEAIAGVEQRFQSVAAHMRRGGSLLYSGDHGGRQHWSPRPFDLPELDRLMRATLTREERSAALGKVLGYDLNDQELAEFESRWKLDASRLPIYPEVSHAASARVRVVPAKPFPSTAAMDELMPALTSAIAAELAAGHREPISLKLSGRAQSVPGREPWVDVMGELPADRLPDLAAVALAVALPAHHVERFSFTPSTGSVYFQLKPGARPPPAFVQALATGLVDPLEAAVHAAGGSATIDEFELLANGFFSTAFLCPSEADALDLFDRVATTAPLLKSAWIAGVRGDPIYRKRRLALVAHLDRAAAPGFPQRATLERIREGVGATVKDYEVRFEEPAGGRVNVDFSAQATPEQEDPLASALQPIAAPGTPARSWRGNGRLRTLELKFEVPAP